MRLVTSGQWLVTSASPRTLAGVVRVLNFLILYYFFLEYTLTLFLDVNKKFIHTLSYDLNIKKRNNNEKTKTIYCHNNNNNNSKILNVINNQLNSLYCSGVAGCKSGAVVCVERASVGVVQAGVQCLDNFSITYCKIMHCHIARPSPLVFISFELGTGVPTCCETKNVTVVSCFVITFILL